MSEEQSAEQSTESTVETITSWRDSLPDDLKSAPSLQDVNDVTTLAKRFIDTKSMVGNSIRLPSGEAGQDVIDSVVSKILENESLGLMKKPNSDNLADVYAQLGRPDDPGGYQAPEGTDAETFGALATKAHELGLSKQQYETLSAAHAEMVNMQMQQMDETRQEGVFQLKGEWGPAFDEKVGRSGNMIKAMGGHEGLEGALSSGSLDAATLRFFDMVATHLGSENSQVAKQLGGATQMTTDELKQRRDELTSRMLKEDLTPSQRQDMQKRLINYSEQILAHGG